MQLKQLLIFFSFLLSTTFAKEIWAQKEVEGIQIIPYDPPPYYTLEDNWIDEKMSELSLRQKIGQLFMVAAYSNKGQRHIDQLSKQINEFGLGGVIFFQGSPYLQAMYTNQIQDQSNIPLLVAQDAEWGLSMRLDSVVQLPKQLALGAVRNNGILYEYGKVVAQQCKRIGVHVNLAPVIDVNNNINNPVINDRSFGENIYNVTNKGIAYMKGMQDAGILACAKHFPGHGDTDSDSHKTLPTIPHSRERLDSIELYPFKRLIQNGIGSIMNAHLYVPSLDSNKFASSLSRKISHDLLRQELGFRGLTFTDALNMKGVSKYFKSGELEVRALLADNDILLFSENIPKAIRAIESAIEDGIISEKLIEDKVRLIMKVKLWCGLDKYKPIQLENITNDLNSPSAQKLKKSIAEYSMTLAKNEDLFLPISNLHGKSYASVALGSEQTTTFQKSIEKYISVDHFFVKKKAHNDTYAYLLDRLKKKDVVFLCVHDLGRYKSNDYNLSLTTLGFIKKLQAHTQVILVLFGTPYSLKYFQDATQAIVAYSDDYYNQKAAAEAIFGATRFLGKLPITASRYFKYASGGVFPEEIRLKYGEPSEIGLSAKSLSKIDSLAEEAIATKCTPGCQILIAKDAKVVYQKSFGYHTYDEIRAVRNNDLYDIASITKVAATTLSLMKLYDEGYFNLYDSLAQHIPSLKNTNKGQIIISDLLIHQAGLKGWIPFYVKAMKDSVDQFTANPSDSFSIEISDNVFMRNAYQDSIWQRIIASDVRPNPRYLYSDIGFYIMQRLVEIKSGQKLNDFIKENIYEPLGLNRIRYLPKEFCSLESIVPTEDDKIFRKGLVHGTVHDPGAAMMGGIAGHAGLFSNTQELAVIMQMLLNKGKYGGKQLYSEQTVKLFTQQFKENNRRGLGFDKPDLSTDNGPTSLECSPSTFGHTGFTGTCMWADPEQNLIYIFLSNRVHPSSAYNKLARTNIRTRIQTEIYKALSSAEF